DPHDAKASVLANKIIYYKISLPDQVLKDGQLLSQKLQNIYTVLDNATKRTVPTLPSTNTTQSNTYDPMSMTDLRTLLFNLDPINPPEDIQQHTQADLKAGLDVDPNTLVGWYITQPRHSDIGYFDIKEEKLPKVEPGGNVVKDYTFQKMGGAVRADYKAYLFSDKIFPPTDITTVFTTGKSNIPLDFQSDDSIDAKKAGFTLANFKNQVAFVIRYLRSYPDIARIKIYGYTDTEGGKTKTGKDRNAILSLSRATSFYSYLQTATDLGVPPLTTDEAKKFVLSYEGKGQDAAEATANAEQIAIGTADFRFRKIAIDYDVK
ncbi:MAG TPA: hypothetical protein VFI33_16445, partial [Puia sp.]|nr:hypothetical protein [Puia sp.]